ncbi:MAG: CBS domain-containing protein, partial [Ilumatobacter sp.]|nr:CBS domain-containing protein [Ilumatobacter sp.]
EHRVSAFPIVDTDGEPVGIVTAADLLQEHPDGAPVSGYMTSPVLTVPCYEQPHIAARIMRNHHIHHVVVTDQHRVVGMVSAYDLLRLVEEHRFVAKPGPTPRKRDRSRR